MPPAPPPPPRLERFYLTYKDAPDAEKLAAIAQLTSAKANAYALYEAARLVGTLKALDLDSARLIFSCAAADTMFFNGLSFERIAQLMARAPAGAFHDPQLRRLFEDLKAGHRNAKRIEGLDATRRIEAALGGAAEPRAAASPAPGGANEDPPAVEETLDRWIEAWMTLINELRAADFDIDATMRGRWSQVRQIAASRDFGKRVLMDLDTANGESQFRRMRRLLTAERGMGPTWDQAWLARLRAQVAAWEKFEPMLDWGSEPPGLEMLASIAIAPQRSLLEFLHDMRAATPSAKWSKRAAELASGPDGAAIRRAVTDWLATLRIGGTPSARNKLWPDVTEYRNFRRRVLGDIEEAGGIEAAALVAFFTSMAPFQIYHDGSGGFGHSPDPGLLSERAALLARSAIWMLAAWNDAESVGVLQRTADMLLVKLSSDRRSTAYRSLAAANAAILALGRIATVEAVQALGRIKLKVRDERLAKQIAKAMETAAEQAGMSVVDLQELAVPTFDLDDVGAKGVSLGDVTATLRVLSTTDATVELARADGRRVKSVPAALKADATAAAALKELNGAAKAIAQALPVHRQRIEQLYLSERSWPLPVWRERFLDHPLIGTLGRRLIWTATAPGAAVRSVIWHDGELVDVHGQVPSRLGDDAVVRLWHPLEAADDETAAWRAFLMRHRIVQPFKQAHRELYPLTDAERATRTYSNRFAGHILRQHQSVALARLRGWRATLRIWADVPNDEPTHLRIPDFDLAAELWTEPADAGDSPEVTDSQAHVFIKTDRVRFRRVLPERNGTLGEGVDLDAVPARIFSEAMRDVDLFIGVASIGNDPTWADAGADAEHPNQWRRAVAQPYWDNHARAALDAAGLNRRQFLVDLLPSLAIGDRCSLDDRYLTVRGHVRTYRIHLGSANIMMDDNRYLCIVPDSAETDMLDAFLPFEGDRMLSIILSKAVMLAHDDKITEQRILSQIRK